MLSMLLVKLFRCSPCPISHQVRKLPAYFIDSYAKRLSRSIKSGLKTVVLKHCKSQCQGVDVWFSVRHKSPFIGKPPLLVDNLKLFEVCVDFCRKDLKSRREQFAPPIHQVRVVDEKPSRGF